MPRRITVTVTFEGANPEPLYNAGSRIVQFGVWLMGGRKARATFKYVDTERIRPAPYPTAPKEE